MVGEKTTLEILQEIQEKLSKENYPVKLDIGEAIEGADIGINVLVEAPWSWELEKKINSIIQRTLRKNNLVAYLDWKWNS